jgi:hypothetical protein
MVFGGWPGINYNRTAGAKKMTFTQPLCLPCWRTDWPDGGMDRDPIPLKAEHAEMETCCLCGRPTNHGIYVRVDPKTVPFPRQEV